MDKMTLSGIREYRQVREHGKLILTLETIDQQALIRLMFM